MYLPVGICWYLQGRFIFLGQAPGPKIVTKSVFYCITASCVNAPSTSGFPYVFNLCHEEESHMG